MAEHEVTLGSRGHCDLCLLPCPSSSPNWGLAPGQCLPYLPLLPGGWLPLNPAASTYSVSQCPCSPGWKEQPWRRGVSRKQGWEAGDLETPISATTLPLEGQPWASINILGITGRSGRRLPRSHSRGSRPRVLPCFLMRFSSFFFPVPSHPSLRGYSMPCTVPAVLLHSEPRDY